ncbi:MAG: MFS transporter [Caldilineaceae bacterium]|nr:MFS transporter [Caldilineaceae bacterium]
MRVFAFFALAHMLSYFFRTANAALAGDLAQEMGLNASQLGLMSSLFFLAFAAAQIPLGIGLDWIGPRWVTPGLLLVGAVGSLLFANAHSFPLLATGRALIGLGTAGVLMGALKAFSRWFPAERYATISTFMVGFGSMGGLAASLPLAYLNVLVGWRGIFLGGAAALAVVAMAIMLWVRNTPPGELWERPQATDGTLRDIFRNGSFWRICGLGFCMNGVLLAMQGLWAGPYFTDVYGFDQLAAGNLLLAIAVGAMLGFGSSGWLADRFGLALIVIIGAALQVGTTLLYAWQPPVAWLWVVNPLFGFGGGISVVLMPQIRRLFPSGLVGRAVSAGNLFSFTGIFVTQWIMGLLINRFAKDQAGHYPPVAYTLALVVIAVCTLAALIGYAPLVRTERKNAHA